MSRETDRNYDEIYRDFDSPLMRRVREEAYGEDIGQHSWVQARELRLDVSRLALSATDKLLDLGCGPCGPLLFVVEATRCRGVGVELSTAALRVGLERASARGLQPFIELRQLDLNGPLPFADQSFTAVISYDVLLHLADRARVFKEVARVLTQRGRFLFTDAAVVTGAISSDQVRLRSGHGFTQFVTDGFNRGTLERAGFRVVESEDRGDGVIQNASGRLRTRLAHREALERVEGVEAFAQQQQYIETVLELARNSSLSRIMYLSELTS